MVDDDINRLVRLKNRRTSGCPIVKGGGRNELSLIFLFYLMGIVFKVLIEIFNEYFLWFSVCTPFV